MDEKNSEDHSAEQVPINRGVSDSTSVAKIQSGAICPTQALGPTTVGTTGRNTGRGRNRGFVQRRAAGFEYGFDEARRFRGGNQRHDSYVTSARTTIHDFSISDKRTRRRNTS
jgi:hypothetical protein